jgi:Fic family protein
MKQLDKKEIDKLFKQINKDRPDLHTLEKNQMASLSHIGHLYVLDNVTLKELSEFWHISKNGVRKRLKEKVKSKSWLFKLAEKNSKAEIQLCPSDAFPDISEYINFLNWRSECRQEESIPIAEVVAILGISKPTVYRYIRIGELHVCDADKNRIMRFSFNMLVQKMILETEFKLHMMKDYINKHRRNLSVPEVPRFHL